MPYQITVDWYRSYRIVDFKKGLIDEIETKTYRAHIFRDNKRATEQPCCCKTTSELTKLIAQLPEINKEDADNITTKQNDAAPGCEHYKSFLKKKLANNKPINQESYLLELEELNKLKDQLRGAILKKERRT